MKKYDILISGEGPAGISAGVYAARNNFSTLLLLRDIKGALNSYPDISLEDVLRFLNEEHKDLKKLTVKEIDQKPIIEKRNSGFYIKAGEEFVGARAVIVDLRGYPNKLDVPGEDRLIGKGVYYSNIFDCVDFKEKQVGIIGGGCSGLETAISLAPYARNIFILEKGDELSGDRYLRKMIEKIKNVQFYLNKKVLEIMGEDKAQSVLYEDINEGKRFQVPAESIFIQVGGSPMLKNIKDAIEINEKIDIDLKTGATSMPALFTAVRGAGAFRMAYNYLKND